MAHLEERMRMEFRLMGSQFDNLSHKVSELNELLSELPRKFDALPRAVAELVVEMLKEREKKS